MNALCHVPAHQLVSLMSAGTVSCREVVQAHLTRIEAVNPLLNALVEAADPDQCLALADDADRRIEMLTFMADFDVIVCPAMPTPDNHTTTAWSKSATSHT